MRASFLASALIGTALATSPALAVDLCTDCYSAIAYADGLSQIPADRGQAGWIVQKEDGGALATSAATSASGTTGRGASFSSSAVADLTTGALHITAQQTNASASGGAQMVDFVKFILPAGMSSATISVSWTIEGINEFVEGLSRASIDTSSLTRFTIDTFSERGMNVGLDGQAIDFHFYSDRDDLGGLDEFGFHSLTLTGTFEVNADNAYRITQALSAFAATDYLPSGLPTGAPSKADFGNTAYFNFTLPEGVSFVSGSGTLLSTPYGASDPGDPTTPAVPELASWAMMMLGFAAMDGLLRHRRTVVVFA